jgi:two-component system phosphate regulon sensor histidine kinase PhoR
VNLGPHLREELARVALLLAAALVGGWLLGQALLMLVVALLGYLLITLLQLAQLERQLGDRWMRPAHEQPPGLWRAIEEHLYESWQRDRRRQREAVRLMRAFREATAAMPDGVVALDRDWGIEWANPAAAELVGVRTPRDAGQHVANLLRVPAFVTALGAARREPIEFASPRAPDRWLTVTLVDYGEGRHLLFARDTTRLRRLEQMRREFVANASHELRSPLTVIGGYLEALREDRAVDPAWSAPLAEMHRQSRRMAGIVDDMLELSRLETDAGEPPLAPVDVRGLLARIREEALALGEGPREVALELAADGALLGSEKELHSAFSNLVFNAMRYTPADGRVAVRWSVEEGLPTVAVSDTGVGIPAEHIPRLTERFYRVDASRSRAKGGTGLGLAIVKHVVQRHGGQLRIASEPGKGSVFTVQLPRQRLAPAAVTGPSRA